MICLFSADLFYRNILNGNTWRYFAMKRILGFLMALMICLGIGFLIAPHDVYAAKQEGDIAGGVYDEVDWRITSDGELINGDEYRYGSCYILHECVTVLCHYFTCISI